MQIKAIKKYLTPWNILVFSILLIAFILRVYKVGEILAFHYDQGRDALVIWDLIHKGKMFLIGPTTGLAGIFRGPFYYYLIAPFYLMGAGDPVWPSVFLAVTSVFALWLLYKLTEEIAGKSAGIIALILGTFSFEIVYASRWLSNPTPMLLLSMLLIWSLFRIYDGQKKYWILTALILGLSMFHFGSSGELFYFPAVAIFAIWRWKNLPDKNTFLKSVGVFVLTVLPLSLFDLRHGGILGGNIKGFLTSGGSFNLPTYRFILDRLSLIFGYFGQLIFHAIYEKEILILICLSIFSLIFIGKVWINDKFKIIAIFLLSLVFGILFFQGNFGNVYQYYLTGYYLIFLVFVAVLLSKSKIFAVLFLLIFLQANFFNIKSYLLTTGKEETAIVLKSQLSAIDWIYKEAGDNKFNVDEYVPPVIPYSYDYLLTWKNNPNNVKDQVPMLFTLYEIDPPHPERLQAWIDRQKGIGKVVKEEKFGGIVVQQRVRIK